MRFSPLRHTINHTNQSIPVTLADAALWNPSPSLIYIFSVIISDRRYTFDLLLGYPLHDLWFTYDGECLHRRFSENQLGTAGYHHASDFVDVSTTPSYSVALGSDLSETPPSTPPDKNGLNQQKLENCDPEGKAADFREVLTHASEDRLENILNYVLERVWTISYIKGSGRVVLGYDARTITVKPTT
ncbi:hypothetical protein YC2023_025335 [Brassica napus]